MPLCRDLGKNLLYILYGYAKKYKKNKEAAGLCDLYAINPKTQNGL